jgi:RNA polymerase sigma-70 factor, ECF subfamily
LYGSSSGYVVSAAPRLQPPRGVGDAEDVVQEAWLRLERAGGAEIRDLRAWLSTTVARLAIDALTSARARRERYVGTWLPEPLVATGGEDEDLADRVTLDESVSMALLVVLEPLTPPERSAFLLYDVFGYSFEQVAGIVGRSPASDPSARRPRPPSRRGSPAALTEGPSRPRPSRSTAPRDCWSTSKERSMSALIALDELRKALIVLV